MCNKSFNLNYDEARMPNKMYKISNLTACFSNVEQAE